MLLGGNRVTPKSKRGKISKKLVFTKHGKMGIKIHVFDTRNRLQISILHETACLKRYNHAMRNYKWIFDTSFMSRDLAKINFDSNIYQPKYRHLLKIWKTNPTCFMLNQHNLMHWIFYNSIIYVVCTESTNVSIFRTYHYHTYILQYKSYQKWEKLRVNTFKLYIAFLWIYVWTREND